MTPPLGPHALERLVAEQADRARPVIPSVADVAVMSDAERYEAAVLAAQQLATDALLARLCSTHPGVVLDAARALVALPSYRLRRRYPAPSY